MDPIYLDHNATTPVDPEVADAMQPFLRKGFGNPSSGHVYGRFARNAVDTARSQVAALLNCGPDEIVFTSGGSEANNTAIKGIAYASQHKGRHIITSAVEHPAVIEVCRFLERIGWRVTLVPVDEAGRVDPGQIRAALAPDTFLVSVMHANNEVGTIQPIQEIAAVCREHGVVVHTDAAQSSGKVPVDPEVLGADFVSLAGHKLYAPKGVGALYCRRGISFEPLIHGAGHESGRRAGTENVLEIVGLGKACEIARRDMASKSVHLREMRDRLHHRLTQAVEDVLLNGHPELRLPNTLSLGFAGVTAALLLESIGDRVLASAGSACHADAVELSAVLQAMGVKRTYGIGTIRFSTGRHTTPAQIDAAADIVADAVGRWRDEHGRRAS